jgi:glycosyltransferase involved in cell wall biosynthesis
MRVLAILATYNEERVIANCLDNLIAHGVDTYLIDNCSTDRTVAIAERYLGQGVVGIETLPRDGVFSLRRQLEAKERVIEAADADWLMHLDADEIRLPPRSGHTLAEAFRSVQEEGYNAVNFMEYTFVPTREEPDHDHPHFVQTMRWYYPFLPRFVHGLKAWKRQEAPVNLKDSGGHHVHFEGMQPYPVPFVMKHYQFLSIPHAIEKYVQRRFDRAEVSDGWHGWRVTIRAEDVLLPSQNELRTFVSDDALDADQPRREHYLQAALRSAERGAQGERFGSC